MLHQILGSRRGRQGRHSYGDPMAVSNDVVPWLQPSKAISHPKSAAENEAFQRTLGSSQLSGIQVRKGEYGVIHCRWDWAVRKRNTNGNDNSYMKGG